MQIQLTQKERMLLEDGKKQENLCAKKYQSYANQVQGPQLKNLLMEIVQEEQHHYNMINQILQGVQPDMTQKPINITTEAHTTFQGPSPKDQILLEDLLSTEKYVSGFYDTAVFEAADPNVRQALQHIQQDEQAHGEKLFNYMHSHGMYDIK
ncbi:Coat F domain protein [[Clostridium] ultunense Esp]|uniref:Coat F domain protein n=1 Tax=[Clostridium] ultunense Esp TaxID=1288971 RepID=M1ZKB2_9FIRM|nr:spore coat protein [Schnuerera ultunensis]CCQ95147.1 Coat F domain protein [[Clostridium] ultunense Esp]SHD77841.1 Coat F domain protein [[Clostridium] ultunense Esp]